VVLESQPVGLAYQELIPDSVAMASDTSLGKVFTENVDYHVNHAEGKLSGWHGSRGKERKTAASLVISLDPHRVLQHPSWVSGLPRPRAHPIRRREWRKWREAICFW
jgi:hypothetical protein